MTKRINGRFWELDRQKRYLYVMQCGEYVKVGMAANPSRRLDEVQAGNPLVVTLAFKRTVAASVVLWGEKHAHKSLAEHHVHREWFRAPVEVAAKAIVEAIKASEPEAVATRWRLHRIAVRAELQRRISMGLDP